MTTSQSEILLPLANCHSWEHLSFDVTAHSPRVPPDGYFLNEQGDN